MMLLSYWLILYVLAQSPEQTPATPPVDATGPTVFLEWRILQLDRDIKMPAKTPSEIRRLMRNVRSTTSPEEQSPPEPNSASECTPLASDFSFDEFIAAMESRYKEDPKPWRVLAMPNVVALMNQEAEITVGRQIPFMVRREDGDFTLVHSPEAFEGVTTTLLVDGGDDRGIAIKKALLRISRVIGRQPIEGVPFDIGYPIINTREVQSALRVQPGRWVLFLLPAIADDDPQILAFLRARILDPGSRTESAIP